MNKLASAIMLSALMSSTAYAAEMGQANPGTGAATRGSPTEEYEFGRGAPLSPPKLEAGEESRAAPMMDETKIIEAFTALTRAADGTVSRTAPSDTMRGLVLEEMKGEAGKGANKIENSKDPAVTEQEADRQVFGSSATWKGHSPGSASLPPKTRSSDWPSFLAAQAARAAGTLSIGDSSGRGSCAWSGPDAESAAAAAMSTATMAEGAFLLMTRFKFAS